MNEQPPPTCQFCNWTNCGCVNIGEAGKAKWICPSCVKGRMNEAERLLGETRTSVEPALMIEGWSTRRDAWLKNKEERNVKL